MENNYQTYIEAGKATRLYLKDIWEYRELFWILAKRDILVRYKQTVIGIAWAVIQPLLTLITFTVVFGKIAGLPSGGAPYILMVLAGTMDWQFFASTVSSGGNSVISNENLKRLRPNQPLMCGEFWSGWFDHWYEKHHVR